MKLHKLKTQNTLKVSTLISVLFSYYLSSTIFSLCYAYFTTIIKTKVPKSISGGLLIELGWVTKIFEN